MMKYLIGFMVVALGIWYLQVLNLNMETTRLEAELADSRKKEISGRTNEKIKYMEKEYNEKIVNIKDLNDSVILDFDWLFSDDTTN